MEIPRKSSRPRKRKTFFDEETRSELYLCSVCSVDVDSPPSGPSIKCSSCQKWVHYFCVPMSSEIHKNWEEDKDAQFLCRGCFFATEIVYNFYAALQRIKTAPENKRLVQAKTEKLLLDTYQVTLPDRGTPAGQTDQISKEILEETHPIILRTYVPLETSGDGNCLYRAISRGLYGNERHHNLLRLLTAIELILHFEVYDENSWNYVDFINDNRVVISPYANLVESAFTDGAYSELQHMYALSSVLRNPIRSYYPPTLKAELLTEPYSRKVVGREVNAPVATIMWTQSIRPKRNQFMPNHFVPLCKIKDTVIEGFNIIEHDWPSLSESSCSATTIHSESPSEESLRVRNSNQKERNTDDINTSRGSNPQDHSKLPILTSTPRDNAEMSEYMSENILLSDINISSSAGLTNSMQSSKEPASGRVPCEGPYRGKLNKEKFLEIEEVLNIFQNIDGSLEKVPAGIKENVFYIVDNTENDRKKSEGRKQDFWDDCGAWIKGTSPSNVFLIVDGKLLQIVKRHGQYCTEKKNKGARVYQPLDPQPSEDELFVLHRSYSKHKLSVNYRRRITWLGNIPSTMTMQPIKVALMEYVGSFPGRSCHGNVRYPENNEDYIRVTNHAKTVIKEKVKDQNPKNLYDKMNRDSEQTVYDLPRNLKQVQNFKYHEKKRERQVNQKHETYHRNLADHILNVENMVYSHPFVRAVTHLKSGPSVILFTDEQIWDVKRFCCGTESSILGVDKTFNLGEMYLTATVFKNNALTRANTGEPPIFIGPSFLHGQSDFETYFNFFSHLSALFSESEIENMVIGTDDETAMRNGIRRAFPKATQVLCTRHLKKNVLHYLEDKIGVNETNRRRIVTALFGTEGVTHADDTVIAEYRIQQAKEVIAETAAEFVPYFEKRLLPLLQEHVIHPSRVKHMDADWTNNNAESVNNLLKIGINWKPQSVSDLVETVYKIVKSLYKDSERSLIGRGNFKLAPSHQHHRVSIDVWCQIGEQDRAAIFLKFFKDKGKTNERTVTSTNGKVTLPTTPLAGKKPHQRKRKRAERCRSIRTTDKHIKKDKKI